MRKLLKVLPVMVFLPLMATSPSYAVSDCVYGGVNFSNGALSCQAGHQYRCIDGDWVDVEVGCNTPPPGATVENPAHCSCSTEEMASCERSGQSCCVSLEGGKCLTMCCRR